MFGDAPKVMVRWKLLVSDGNWQVVGRVADGTGEAVAVGEGVTVGEGVAVGEAVGFGEAVAWGVPVSLTAARASALVAVVVVSSSSLSVTPQAVESATPKIRARDASRVLMSALQ